MQTIWVLMGETGMIPKPFKLVKSYRLSDRKNRSAVMPVHVGIETFYKAFIQSKPLNFSAEDVVTGWRPEKFKTKIMQRLLAASINYAKLKIPILILGERGTGKTTLASWIRANSPFRKKENDDNWPAVACGQYDSGTMRSELFGHEKGSFTGAIYAKEGLLERANGDTLFLDEIGDIPRDLQRMLIKAIEEKKFSKVGSGKTSESDFRLICATNLKINELKKRIEPDFFDRISPLILELPSLSEIPEEIDWLWKETYQEAIKRSCVSDKVETLSEKEHQNIIKILKNNRLKGNIRDLYKVAYNIIAMSFDIDKNIIGIITEILESDFPPSNDFHDIILAIANGTSLDKYIKDKECLYTQELFNELKLNIAVELKRIARICGKKREELCDVAERTLNEWERWQKKS